MKKSDNNTHAFPIRIYYEDTDVTGYVYHANYLKFMERARTEYLADLGFPVDQLNEVYKIQFVVSKLAIRYFLPAYLGDKLVVHTCIQTCKRASVGFLQQIYRDRLLVVEAEVQIACINQKMRPTAIPKVIRQVIQQELIRGD